MSITVRHHYVPIRLMNQSLSKNGYRNESQPSESLSHCKHYSHTPTLLDVHSSFIYNGTVLETFQMAISWQMEQHSIYSVEYYLPVCLQKELCWAQEALCNRYRLSDSIGISNSWHSWKCKSMYSDLKQTSSCLETRRERERRKDYKVAWRNFWQ